jgi:hypothetical protein
MDITTVKIINDDNDNHSGYLLDGELNVPLDSGNRHYQAIQDWIAEGNTPTDAD